MKKNIIICLVCSLLLASNAFGADPDSRKKKVEVIARAGYSIGGTAPLGIPATIRSIDAFRPTASMMAGADLKLSLIGSWGIMAGLHYENKAMDAEVTTKGYRMEVVKGDSRIEGLFTGHVKQEVTQKMLTVPVMLTCRLGNRVTWKVGPYISFLSIWEPRKANGLPTTSATRCWIVNLVSLWASTGALLSTSAS